MDTIMNKKAHYSSLFNQAVSRFRNDFDERAKLNSFWKTFKKSVLTNQNNEITCNDNKSGSFVESNKNTTTISFYDTNDNLIFPALKKLYIREHYASLFKEMQKYDGCTITGSPGIGKSSFILYVLLEFYKASKAKNERFRLIIVKGNKKIKEYFLFTEHFCIPISTDDFSEYCTDSECVILIDQKYDDVCDGILSKVFLFSSPNKENFNKLEKVWPVKLYMPTWSLKELRSLNRIAYGLSDEDIQKNFFVFGGKPRFIFSQDIETFKREVSFHIIKHTRENQGARYLVDLAKQIVDSQGKVLGLPFKLTAYTLASDDFTECQIDMASDWIREIFFNKLKDSPKPDLIDFFNFSNAKFFFSLRGIMWEFAATHILARGGIFEARKFCYTRKAFYKDETNPNIEFPKKSTKITYRFDLLTEETILRDGKTWTAPILLSESTILVPQSYVNDGIDAFNIHFGGLQMTAADKHDFPDSYRKNLKALCGTGKSKLMFVVPIENLDQFRFVGFTKDKKLVADQTSDIEICIIGINCMDFLNKGDFTDPRG